MTKTSLIFKPYITYILIFILAIQSNGYALAPSSAFITLSQDQINQKVLQIGNDLFDIMETKESVLSMNQFLNKSKNKLKDFFMDLGMKSVQLKVVLLEFLDVAPVLKTSRQVFTQILEVFQINPLLQTLIKASVLFAYIPLSYFFTPMILIYPLFLFFFKTLVHQSIRFMATRFIASETIEKLIPQIDQLKNEGADVTIDVLGEGITTRKQAGDTIDIYLNLLKKVKNPNVSVKLTALGPNFDPLSIEGQTETKNNLRKILTEAKKQNGFVYLDMEEYKYKDLTLKLFKEILEEEEFKNFDRFGIILQAYLTDTKNDVEKLLSWAKERNRSVPIRLVKGAYWDQENIWARQEDREDHVPVFLEKEQTDANYEEISELLLQHMALALKQNLPPPILPAFASHNTRSVAKVMALMEELQIPKNMIEFQMLYGMGEQLRRAVTQSGYRVRVYAPFGALIPGMAYLVRRVLENTANEGFLSQSKGVLTPAKRAHLLMDPRDLLKLKNIIQPEKRIPNRQRSDFKEFTNEPLTEWHREENQNKMKQALRHVQSIMQQEGHHQIPIVINGQNMESQTKYISQNTSNPLESTPVGIVSMASAEQAELAIESAQSAFNEWSQPVHLNERIEILFNAAEIMRKRKFELAAWIVYEVGKPWADADADVAEAIDFLEYYALNMKNIGTDEFEPIGPGVVIAPWNFPLAILTGMTAAALVTGNTVVMKPAEQSSVIGYELMKIFQEAIPDHFPKGVVNFLPGIGEIAGDHLIKNIKTRFIAFTGSTTVGDIIRKAAANSPTPKNVILETGGKNAIYVDRTADLDQAVQGVIDSFIGFNGQKCSACSRLFIHEAIYDVFLERLVEKVQSTIIGESENPSSQITSVIDQEVAAKIMQMIQNAKDERWGENNQEHWHLNFGGSFFDRGKRQFKPTIFSSTSDTAYLTDLAKYEIFGPVLAVMKAKNANHAIQMINHSGFGLTSGIFSRNESQKKTFIQHIQAGVIYLNRKITAAMVAIVGFGGIKASGTGIQAGSPDYLFQFLKPKSQSQLPYTELQTPNFSFKASINYLNLHAISQDFHQWKNTNFKNRLKVLQRLSTKIQIPEELKQALALINEGRPLRNIIGIHNGQIYESLGIGIIMPSSNYETTLRMVMTAIFTGNAVILPRTEDTIKIQALFQSIRGIPTHLIQLEEAIDGKWLKDPNIRFIAYTEENSNFDRLVRRTIHLNAASSTYPTRVIVETAIASEAWTHFDIYHLSRFLQTKSYLEVLPPQLANKAFLEEREFVRQKMSQQASQIESAS